jgi:enamine deaminase RidA (YjgF/YER057c/UK114 family)
MKQSIMIFLIILSACSPKSGETSNSERLYDYDVEERIKGMGIELIEPGNPVANYVNSVKSGNLIFMSGKGPRNPDGTLVTGKIGTDLTVDDGYQAARLTAIEQLSVLKAQIGDLNKVERIVKVLGMVNADVSFTEHPAVINGFSDLMVEIFGERGKHARAAVGMASLPSNIACEIEMIVQIKE